MLRCAFQWLVLVLALSACAGSGTSAGSSTARAFVGGLLIDGNGGTPLANSVLIVDGGEIQAVGHRAIDYHLGVDPAPMRMRKKVASFVREQSNKLRRK